MVTIRPVTAGAGVIEGSYTSWSSLGIITLPFTPSDRTDISCLVDCQNEVVHVAYYVGNPTFASYLAAYQLPGKSAISNVANGADLSCAQVCGTGHGICGRRGAYMSASVSGMYVLQVTEEPHVIVTKEGVEIEDVAISFAPYTSYISPDGHYIVLTESDSPFRLEIYEGS